MRSNVCFISLFCIYVYNIQQVILKILLNSAVILDFQNGFKKLCAARQRTWQIIHFASIFEKYKLHRVWFLDEAFRQSRSMSSNVVMKHSVSVLAGSQLSVFKRLFFAYAWLWTLCLWHCIFSWKRRISQNFSPARYCTVHWGRPNSLQILFALISY